MGFKYLQIVITCWSTWNISTHGFYLRKYGIYMYICVYVCSINISTILYWFTSFSKHLLLLSTCFSNKVCASFIWRRTPWCSPLRDPSSSCKCLHSSTCYKTKATNNNNSWRLLLLLLWLLLLSASSSYYYVPALIHVLMSSVWLLDWFQGLTCWSRWELGLCDVRVPDGKYSASAAAQITHTSGDCSHTPVCDAIHQLAWLHIQKMSFNH